MPRKAAGLTAAKVSKAGPGQYMDGNGLRLFVRGTGARFWIFRYTMAGKTSEMGLGRAGAEPGAVPLSDARQKAGELHRLVKSGTDPLAQRDAERFIAGNKSGWRNAKHRAQWGSTLATYAYPHMGDLPVADVGTEHVLAALHPIWTTKPETAARLRGRIEAVLDYTRATELRTPEITPRGGGGTCPIPCQHAPRSHPWNTMRRCRGPTWGCSWRRCKASPALVPALSPLPS